MIICPPAPQFSKASVGPPAAALAALGRDRVFLASWVADSLLLAAVQQKAKVRPLMMPSGDHSPCTLGHAMLHISRTCPQAPRTD